MTGHDDSTINIVVVVVVVVVSIMIINHPLSLLPRDAVLERHLLSSRRVPVRLSVRPSVRNKPVINCIETV